MIAEPTINIQDYKFFIEIWYFCFVSVREQL